MTSITERGGNRVLKEQSFRMLLKLSCYKFKLEHCKFRISNVLSLVTTKKTVIEHTQKEKGMKMFHHKISIKHNKSSEKNELPKKDLSHIENIIKQGSPSLSIILQVNGLNSLFKRQRLVEWIKI